MRRIAILFLLFPLKLSAQEEWAPIGAKWYFNVPSSSSESGDYIVFESKKDSTIQGKNVRILDVKRNGNIPISQEYVYQNGDSVFYYNSNYSSFFLLYNFSAKAGDTIKVHPNKFKPTEGFFSYYDSISYFMYKIISIDSIEISGHWIKRQKVTSLKDALWSFSKPDGNEYYILNKIGSLAYFFGVQTGFTPEENLSICRCYKDSNIEYNNPLWGYDCDLYSAINEDRYIDDDMIFPNPFTDQLNIKIGKTIKKIEVFDMNGIKLQTVQSNNELVVLNTTYLNNGFYLLRIMTEHQVYFRKLLKNKPQ